MQTFRQIFPFLLPFIIIGWFLVVLQLVALIGGWKRLSNRFYAARQPEGEKLRNQSARIGWANYGGCLTVVIAGEGLYLSVWGPFRIGHPPILIPWREINHVRQRNFLWNEYVQFDVGMPAIATLNVKKSLFAKIEPRLQPIKTR
jgi:hypothetical protein